MSAALVDLVAVGAQDAYITGEPQVSFWRQNYKRYTNFALKPERMDYIGTFTSGAEVVVPIRSKGDLLSYIWVEHPNISNVGVNTDGLFSSGDTSVTEFSLHVLAVDFRTYTSISGLRMHRIGKIDRCGVLRQLH